MDNFTKKAIDKLRYEFNMFHYTAKYLHEHKDDKNELSTAVLESFLIHARLIHGFFRKQGQKDDLVAEGFIDNVALWKKKKSLIKEI
jgi:hypothetical protein